MMKRVACVIFAVLCVLHLSSAEEAFEPIKLPEYESQESLAARSFEKRDCSKNTEEGPHYCDALFYRYKWSDQDQDCVKAVYGGCHPTKNNFGTVEECQKVTFPICKKN